MICEHVKKYCKDYKKIENYDKAVSDITQIWHCHHRLETHNFSGEQRPIDLSPKELKALDIYYNRPANELIFLTPSDHMILHKKGKEGKKISNCVFWCFGKERYTDNVASTTKLAAYLSQYTDKEASAIYQQILRTYKKTTETGKAYSFKLKAKASLLNDFTIDPDLFDTDGNITVYISDDDSFDVVENKIENVTDNMAEYQKVKLWIKRNPGKTSFPKKWSEENIALANKLLSK